MSILVVDDSRTQLFLLTSVLNTGGYTDIIDATSSQEAFNRLGINSPVEQPCNVDLILMDLDMPDIDGLEACRRIKAIAELRDIPIIVITASSGSEMLKTAFEAGAMDYIAKPPDEVEMLARVRSALHLKEVINQLKVREKNLVRLSQNLADLLEQLQTEQDKSEQLLLNILPKPIAVRLKAGEKVIADYYSQATVMFTDVVNFTSFASLVSPAEMVESLNQLFKRIDVLVKKHSLEKIKTSGDAYMVAGGLPMPRQDHLEAMADLALDIQANLNQGLKQKLHVRTGMHTGPVIAGVIGDERFIYDIWGDTVNVASRMQAICPPDRTLVTPDVYWRLKDQYTFESQGEMKVKGKGHMEVYLLTGKKA